MREPFGANVGITQNVTYIMVAVLIAVAVIGSICGEIRKQEAANVAATETTESVSGH